MKISFPESKYLSSYKAHLITYELFRYLLTSYDQNYPEYLTAIGIPSFVVNMFILASKEIIHVTKTGNHIKFTTKTGIFHLSK